MAFSVPAGLEAELEALVARYPQKRSASLMFLHALQEHFGFVSNEAVEWTAARLGLQPINVLELVTFYPMFRQEKLGRTQVKVCRTLSCALAGASELRAQFCTRLGLDAGRHGPQTTPDGKFTVEFVECLADCGNAPVVMVNDDLIGKCSGADCDRVIAKGQ
ncbi:MAG: NAD(P)H-dependent oxidoreductase subunit E [Verrucomicrobia bacterium]|nr:MAG: NAD(P)H-dependent oxidoreductase subunit E [Verrucomicrobiota bacterium]